MKIILSSKAESLAAALAVFASTVTVEAEYGDVVVEGSILTLAHHGSRSSNPAPSLAVNGVAGDPGLIEAIGVSHLDADTLMAIVAILMGKFGEYLDFCKLIAYVDVNGPHKISQCGAEPKDIARLYALWAWNYAHKVFSPRDGSILDVTETVMAGVQAIQRICADDPELLAAGEAFRLEGETLNKRSFVQIEGGVIVRVCNAFTNHLYNSPDGEIAQACVAFDTVVGSITISLADPIVGVSACAIVQSLWGAEAGGHTGIAGSPRGKRMTLADLLAAFVAVQTAIRA